MATGSFVIPFWSDRIITTDGLVKNNAVWDTTREPYMFYAYSAEPYIQIRIGIKSIYDTSREYIWENTFNTISDNGYYEGTFFLDADDRQCLYNNIRGFAEQGGVEPYTYFDHAQVWIEGLRLGESEYEGLAYEIITIGVSDTCPEISATVVDTNAVTQSLTGDSSTLIRYHSNAKVSVTATGKGGADIAEIGITNGAITMINRNPYNFEKVEFGTFEVYAIDNKEESVFATLNPSFVEYVKPTARINTGIITGDGELTIKVSGNYFDGSFGAVNNELFVYYRYKLQNQEDSEYTNWIRMTDVYVNTDAHNYTANAYATGLDYRKTYVFQAQIADALETNSSVERVVVSLPVFDWSDKDFNFNVPVTIQGKLVGGANSILWQGNDVMHAGSVAELSGAVSEQPQGIVLVFSNVSGDVSWNTFYVPKEMISFYNGGGHTFLMAINAGLSTFGAKYLYISDTSISGHATNQESGVAASNIKFSNANYVLRYVIGV